MSVWYLAYLTASSHGSRAHMLLVDLKNKSFFLGENIYKFSTYLECFGSKWHLWCYMRKILVSKWDLNYIFKSVDFIVCKYENLDINSYEVQQLHHTMKHCLHENLPTLWHIWYLSDAMDLINIVLVGWIVELLTLCLNLHFYNSVSPKYA